MKPWRGLGEEPGGFALQREGRLVLQRGWGFHSAAQALACEVRSCEFVSVPPQKKAVKTAGALPGQKQLLKSSVSIVHEERQG